MQKEDIDSFIEHNLIPKKVLYKKINNADETIEYQMTMRLFEILRLKFSDEQKAYILNYLSNKGITVLGYSDDMSFESEDYILTRRYRGRTPKSISSEETKKLLELYCQTRSEDIRNEIVIGNMRLVNFAIIKLNSNYHGDIYDLEQAGYMGLIKAVENYDSSKGAFSTFAMSYINGYIRLELYEQRGLKKSEYAFYISMKQVEKEYGEKIMNNPALAEVVVDRLIDNGFISAVNKEDNIRRVLLLNALSLDNVLEKEETIYNLGYEVEDNHINNIYDNELEKLVNIEIRKLQELKSEILKMRYGLVDNDPKTLSEIGEKVDLSSTWVKNHIKRSLYQLSATENVKTLELYLHREI